MTAEELIALPQFGISAEEKRRLLLSEGTTLTRLHYERSEAYRRILDAFGRDSHNFADLADLPYLPARLFKEVALRSIPPEQVTTVLRSSGTTSNRPSTVFLDAETARLQARALSAIMKVALGDRRLPMLIIDSEDALRKRTEFTARGAGILGMMNLGRDHCFALDDNLELRREVVVNFVQKHRGSKILIFGFTFMVWQYLANRLQAGELDLSNAVLIHSGGWKKLLDIAVGNAEYKRRMADLTGLRNVHNFYGMVEQVGSVFLECPSGHLHAPTIADILIRDPTTWRSAPVGTSGLIQVISCLPRSYPGHSILSEDLGQLLGEDNCPSGWKGKYFEVLGRVPRVELRGCSDTHAVEVRS